MKKTELLILNGHPRAAKAPVPRFPRLLVLQKILDLGLLPVFWDSDLEVAKRVARACVEGGCLVLEWSNRGEHAFELFSELECYCGAEMPQLILGVGSVRDAESAAFFLNCGATFVSGSTLNPEVAKVCNRRKIPYFPGCATPTEIEQAEEMGCEIVKIFPGDSAGGAGFVKAIKGPSPWSTLMPSGGVEFAESTLREWFEAGVGCVEAEQQVISRDLVRLGDYRAISSHMAQALGLIKKNRRRQE